MLVRSDVRPGKLLEIGKEAAYPLPVLLNQSLRSRHFTLCSNRAVSLAKFQKLDVSRTRDPG